MKPLPVPMEGRADEIGPDSGGWVYWLRRMMTGFRKSGEVRVGRLKNLLSGCRRALILSGQADGLNVDVHRVLNPAGIPPAHGDRNRKSPVAAMPKYRLIPSH